MAVFTELSIEEADLLEGYNIGTIKKIMGIQAGTDNSNFLITTDKAPYILTIFEDRVPRNELPFFMDLKIHLEKKGFPCPLPIKTKTGEYFVSIKGKMAALATFIQGKKPEVINEVHCKEIGKCMAKMHLYTTDFPIYRKNDLSLLRWTEIFESIKDKINFIEEGMERLVQNTIHFLVKNWPTHLPNGIIHADLFPDNTLFLDKRINGVIDFYFACSDYYIYDLAITLNSWCFEATDEFNIAKANALFNGYNSVRALFEEELLYLPIIAQGAALRILLTRSFFWLNSISGPLLTIKQPHEYLNKLKFHQSITQFADYQIKLIGKS